MASIGEQGMRPSFSVQRERGREGERERGKMEREGVREGDRGRDGEREREGERGREGALTVNVMRLSQAQEKD